MPLVEAMAAGVPVVARGAGAVGETTAGAALLLAAADPSYIAAALHRVCTDDGVRAAMQAAREATCRRAGGRWRGHPDGGRDRRGGDAVSGKVAFVTPRYGTQIMGGAETAVASWPSTCVR